MRRYAKVLPFLNKRPLMASVGHAGMGAVGRSNASNPLSVLARGGDASGARLAVEAARACMAAHGVAPRRAHALVEMGVRHVFMEAALQDLAQVPWERLGAAPAAALECACRAGAYTRPLSAQPEPLPTQNTNRHPPIPPDTP